MPRPRTISLPRSGLPRLSFRGAALAARPGTPAQVGSARIACDLELFAVADGGGFVVKLVFWEHIIEGRFDRLTVAEWRPDLTGLVSFLQWFDVPEGVFRCWSPAARLQFQARWRDDLSALYEAADLDESVPPAALPAA